MVVKLFSRLKLFFRKGYLIGVCSLLTSMQRLGSLPVFGVGSAKGSECPPQGEVALVVGLIPVSVSGAGVQISGGVEQEEDKFGTPKSD